LDARRPAVVAGEPDHDERAAARADQRDIVVIGFDDEDRLIDCAANGDLVGARVEADLAEIVEQDRQRGIVRVGAGAVLSGLKV
jgi:hypothetical protein